MACEKYRLLLPLCMDGVCLDEPEVHRLQAHLAVCPECAREAEKYCAMVDLIGRECRLPVEAPSDFCSRVMRRLDEQERASARHLGFLWPPLVAGSVAAAAFLLVLVAFQPLNRGDLTPMTLSNLRPALEKQTIPPLTAQPAVPARAEKLARTVFGQAPASNPDSLAAEPDLVGQVTRRVREEDDVLPAAGFGGAGLVQNVAYAPGAPAPAFPAAAPVAIPVRPASQPSEWSGEWCALSAPEQLVAKTPADLARVWQRSGLTPPLAQLAWGRQMLAAVFIGDRPGKGYEVHLTSVIPQSDRVLVRYHVSPPAGADRLDPRGSRPYLLALIPYSDLPAVFEAE